MTQHEQSQFVADIIDTVHAEILELFVHHKIPATWRGPELLQLLMDKFSRHVEPMNAKRFKQYSNVCLVHNL